MKTTSNFHIFAASISETTPELTLQIVCGGKPKSSNAMMNTSLAIVAAKALPALSGSSITYNPERNVYLTLGYTSAANNTYYKAIRFSKRLAVYYDIGEGYAHTFLNGITLFCWDGQKAKIIAQKFWGGDDWRCFSEQFAKEQSIIMQKDFLKGQAKALGCQVSEQQILSFSREMIEETQRKQLA